MHILICIPTIQIYIYIHVEILGVHCCHAAEAVLPKKEQRKQQLALLKAGAHKERVIAWYK